MKVLGIETSCDETAAAVVQDGRAVLSSVVFSQVVLHQPYGGVVPEIASRNHVDHLPAVVRQAMVEAGVDWAQIDAVAVTYGPGLATSLLVGIATAKALALRLRKPLFGINHLEAHLHSVFLAPDAPCPSELCPLIVLMVSGGHTCLVRMDAPGRVRLLGYTVDDAAGEAFDKGANLMGLGYPGGPAIDQISRSGNPRTVRFPRGRVRKTPEVTDCSPELCFSFSGLKTSLLYFLKEHPLAGGPERRADIAASYQEAVVDALVQRVAKAMKLENLKRIAAVGGVSLNHRLRQRLEILARQTQSRLFLAPPVYCADNAAMVAGAAGQGLGIQGEAAFELDACPNLGIGYDVDTQP